MAKVYKKKPISVSAIELASENVEELKTFVDRVTVLDKGGKLSAKICTLEGDMECVEGDFIITGVQGEMYPCKREIFLQTYDLVEKNVI